METMKLSMKSLLGIVLSLTILSSCQTKDKNDLESSVVFKFQTSNAATLKNTKTKSEPIASAIIVTIEKQGGGVVYNREKVDLINLNGSYLSKSLTLEQGNYNLTEFLVIDGNNQVIYAAPKKDCNLAQLVNNPLPISFNTLSNTENIVVPEVIKTDSISLQDLGYVAFSFNYVNTLKLLMTVFSKEPNQTNIESLDSSYLFLTTPGGKTYNLTLRNNVNSIYLNNDSSTWSDPSFYESNKYYLYVYKKGYKSWADTLTKGQLLSYSSAPLQVVLQPIGVPSLTVFYTENEGDEYFHFSINTRSTSDFYVDYGDGTCNKVTSDKQYSFARSSGNPFKPSNGPMMLQLWGNLDDIQSVHFSNGPTPLTGSYTILGDLDLNSATTIENIDFLRVGFKNSNFQYNSGALKGIGLWRSLVSFNFIKNCLNLETIDLDRADTCTLDIHANNLLKTLTFNGISPVLFGANPNLTTINISSGIYTMSPNSQQADSLLKGLLASVKKYPRAGSFNVDFNISTGFNPGPVGLQAVRKLKSNFNWIFTPDIQ